MSAAREVEKLLARCVAALPGGGEVRSGQLAMAEAVDVALRAGRHLVVRAGTGTGKSLAYAVPLALSGRRVVVATATKALQDQLARKDLPQLASAFERPFDFAVLKGRSNYLCLQRVSESQLAGEQGALGEETVVARGAGEEAQTIVEWAGVTATGDRAELEFEPDLRVWSSFSVTAEECPGAFRCPSGASCFAERARARAAEADVIVINHHLLGADLASGGAVLPEHDALVVDEAHELEEIVSASLGTRITASRVRVAAIAARSALSRRDSAAAERLLDDAGDLEQALRPREGERLPAGIGGELAQLLARIGARLDQLVSSLQSAAGKPGGGEEGQAAMRAGLALGRLREEVAHVLNLDEDHVAWVEGGPRPALEVAPIEVAPMLAEGLFAKHPVVLASATVPPGLARRLGAEPGSFDELDVGSPFAYEHNALLYCAAHVADRRRPESSAAIVDELAALITAAGGRTLALFTSRAAMEAAGAALRDRLTVPLLLQGERSKGALVEAFRDDPEVCLFATMGFWQGVDVPGDTLSLVVIDRIPFARPDHPLAAARRERAGPDAFRLVDLPRAASLLAQGAGRLVRSAGDRGVVAVLDSRLATASYRWDLVRALPPMRRTKVRAEAEAFLREIDEAARASDAAPVSTPAAR